MGTMMDPNLDEILRLLSAQYRRQTIRVLRKTPGEEVGFNELIDYLVQGTKANSDQRDQIIIQLHHNHLPKLHEQGLIMIQTLNSCDTVPTSRSKR